MKVLYVTILATAIVAQPFPEAADTEENELSERFFRPQGGFRDPGYQGIGGAYGNGLGYQPYGYQPGSGFGGADVAFTNTGPLGRPALSYQAPGMSINLREKEKDKREASAEANPEADPVGKEEPKGKFFGLSRPVSTSSTSLTHTSVSKPGFGSGFNSGHGGFNRPAFNRPGFNRPGYNRPGLNNGFGQPVGYQPGSGYNGANVNFSNIGPNGRPALNYQAPGMSVDIRKKQKQG